jgi:hypothetical protein
VYIYHIGVTTNGDFLKNFWTPLGMFFLVKFSSFQKLACSLTF